MNWRSPGFFLIAISIIVLLGGGVYFGLAHGQPTPSQAPNQISPTTTPVTAPKLKATTGIAPTVVLNNNTWTTYRNSTIGLTLRYPTNWKYIEEPQQSGVKLYAPDSDPTHPSPLIAVEFAPDYPYDLHPTPSSRTTEPQPVTVSGITGRQYEDTGFAIPDQAFSIELPYRTGSILITATKGPYVNLVPQLQEILKTVILQP